MQPHPDGQFPELAVVDEKKCVGCRLCEEACIWEAIYMDGSRLTSLSQTPLKDTFVDKIFPSDATVGQRDDSQQMRKEYFEEKEDTKTDS